MELQYYTPSDEELHIGYRCEVLTSVGWIPTKVVNNNFCSTVKILNTDNGVRVPCLMVEQIEVEGWTQQINENIYYICINALCEFRMYVDSELNVIEIERIIMDNTDVIYKGRCRCINDFRLICKLLNIK